MWKTRAKYLNIHCTLITIHLKWKKKKKKKDEGRSEDKAKSSLFLLVALGSVVVLLELLSGRKPISSGCPKGQESIVMWAKPILDDRKYSQLLDPSLLDNNNDNDQMQRMALAATLCIRRSPQARPKMSIILKLLKGDEDAHEWAMQQVSSSSEESEMLKDDEQCQRSNLQSHLNVALLDVEDDSTSMGSIEQGVSVEDYLKGRTSRSSSFD